MLRNAEGLLDSTKPDRDRVVTTRSPTRMWLRRICDGGVLHRGPRRCRATACDRGTACVCAASSPPGIARTPARRARTV